MKWLHYMVEHGSHSAQSAMHNLGSGGGGGEPRKDPIGAAMMCMTIGIAIGRLRERDLLLEWVEIESGRLDALDNIDKAPVYGGGAACQESRLEAIERSPVFRRGVQELHRDMAARLKREGESSND